MGDVENQDVPVHDPVDDDVLAHGEAAQTGTQIVVPATAKLGKPGEQYESFSNPLPHWWLLGRNSGAPPTFHGFSKLTHGLLSDGMATARGEGIFSPIDSYKNLHPAALSILPQGQRFLHCLFRSAKSARLDGVEDERFLVGRQTDFHASRVGGLERDCQDATRCRGVASHPTRLMAGPLKPSPCSIRGSAKPKRK